MSTMNHTATHRVHSLIATYAESHQHPTNEVIHFVCVPVIMFSLLGLVWSVSPIAALVLVAGSLVYYFALSVPLAVGMLLLSAAMVALLSALPQAHLLTVSVAVFVLAWIGQFIGHKIEGKKPAFFDDVRFLLIGPLFVLGFLYRRLRIAY
jgi:uncharacterized membrane protein YGL010W